MKILTQKPIEEWTLADLQTVVDEEWQEDIGFEIKQSLPLKHGSNGWVQSGKIHNSERDALAKEIVALANSRGGLVVVGIEESTDHPKRAANLATPIPNIQSLKDQLSRAWSSVIDPPIVSLKVAAISDSNGDGYLLIDVPQSSNMPHGVGSPPACYMRTRDEVRPMSMRDIHSSFWETRSQRERLDELFLEKHEQFKALQKLQSTVAFRISAIPAKSMELRMLRKRIDSGQLLRTAGVQNGRHAESAAMWPFWDRQWTPDANCVRKKFENRGIIKNGYWEIDSSGAVSVFSAINGESANDMQISIDIRWIRNTLADLLALAHAIAIDEGASASEWWVDGEARSFPFAPFVSYEDERVVRSQLNDGKKFRPVAVELSDRVVGAEHLDEAVSSIFSVPCLTDGRTIENDYVANLKDLGMS